MANVGKIFEGEINRLLEQICALVGRQYDLRGSRFTTKKVFDFFACSRDGQFWGIECKATRAKVFEFSRLRPHQREALTTIADAGGEAFLALNFRGAKSSGRAFFVPWDYWCAFEEKWHKKSIKKTEAAEAFRMFELKRITGGWSQTNPLT